jgi:hypothetical protein
LNALRSRRGSVRARVLKTGAIEARVIAGEHVRDVLLYVENGLRAAVVRTLLCNPNDRGQGLVMSTGDRPRRMTRPTRANRDTVKEREHVAAWAREIGVADPELQQA